MLFYDSIPLSRHDGRSNSTNEPISNDINPVATTPSRMNQLLRYRPYAFIPYQTHSPTDSPSTTLKVHNTSTWTYAGPILRSNALPQSYHTWANATTSHPPTLLARLTPFLVFLHDFLEDAGVDAYWLTIRASTPNHDYDTPRWHVDDDFFSNPDRLSANSHTSTPIVQIPSNIHNTAACDQSLERWKLCTTLLGPPTLFQLNNTHALTTFHTLSARTHATAALESHNCTPIRCLGCATYTASRRATLATSLAQEPVVSPRPGEAALFRIGDVGAVHSEPRCDGERVFVNVVPGEEGELRELLGRWGMGWPRAWSVGVPVRFGGNEAEKEKSGVEIGVGADEVEGRMGDLATGKMNGNMDEAYGKWLEDKGVNAAEVFGFRQCSRLRDGEIRATSIE